MNRRNFLKIVGGAGVVLAAGTGGFLATRTPGSALKPWELAGTDYTDPMRKALSYALLAPNPHNRQPWAIQLNGDDQGTLYCDLDRRLPATDPFDRQIVIGLGCFLELFSLAAAADGFDAQISLFPEGAPQGDEAGRLDQRPIAHLTLTPKSDLKPDPLFAHCLERRTNRFAYDPVRPVSEDAKATIIKAGMVSLKPNTDAIDFVSKDPDLEAMQTIVIDAMLAEAHAHEAHMESVNLMRIGVKEVDANPDGISIYGPMMDSLKLVGALNRDALADTDGAMFKGGFEPMLDAVAKTPNFVYINTEANDRAAQIAAGRAYMRICLAATGLGLSMQPVSQALQEYAEMSSLFDRLHGQIASDGEKRVQMLCRIGYGGATSPAPRWPLENRIRI